MTTTPEFGDSTDEVGTDKKRLIIAGGLAAALVLGAGGFLLLSGGGEEETGLVVPAAKRPAVVKPATKVVKPATKVPVISAAKLGRDPFIARYTVPVAPPAAPVTTTPTDTTGTGTGTETTATEPYSLTLLSITGSDAKLYGFNVDGTKKTVVAAQRFGTYGELVVLAYIKNTKGVITGALLQVGDDDPVTVDLGEKISVL